MVQHTLPDIFEDCIRRLAAGQTVEECLRLYPTHSDRLRPLLETGNTIRQIRVPQAELMEDRALVWRQIERQFPRRLSRRGRGSRAVLQLLVAVFLLLLLMTATWFVLTRPDLPRDEEPVIVPIAETNTPSPTPSITLTITPSPSASMTLTPSSTISPTPTLTHTATRTATTTATLSPTFTATASLTLTTTAASACGTPLSELDAVNRVLEIYPNTTVTSISQQTKFGGTLVWEVQTSHGIEVNIDLACGTILTIETDDGDDGNQNSNDNVSNSGSNDNSNDPGDSNTNSDDDSNDNGDSDDNDDNSGHGSGDDDDDDNSGSGSDD